MKNELKNIAVSNNVNDVIEEIKYTISLITPDFDNAFFENTVSDIENLFNGLYPGYRASNTRYHNMEHTNSVILATARLIHGAFVENHTFLPENIMICLMAALFHDTGLIQTTDDTQGSGAKHTIGHEKRSIAFMEKYLAKKNVPAASIRNCSHIIMSTKLNQKIKDIPYTSPEIEMLGMILGTCDLLAQMADREYLEKLFLLFREFEEAGIPDFTSELQLLKKTKDFYTDTATNRFINELDSVCSFMVSHFRKRWEMDIDIYAESITKNITYLDSIISKCDECYKCYVNFLRRGDIIKKPVS